MRKLRFVRDCDFLSLENISRNISIKFKNLCVFKVVFFVNSYMD